MLSKTGMADNTLIGSEVIIAWDHYVKLERWRGTIVSLNNGMVHFKRTDGEVFFINPTASRLQYVQLINACQ